MNSTFARIAAPTHRLMAYLPAGAVATYPGMFLTGLRGLVTGGIHSLVGGWLVFGGIVIVNAIRNECVYDNTFDTVARILFGGAHYTLMLSLALESVRCQSLLSPFTALLPFAIAGQRYSPVFAFSAFVFAAIVTFVMPFVSARKLGPGVLPRERLTAAENECIIAMMGYARLSVLLAPIVIIPVALGCRELIRFVALRASHGESAFRAGYRAFAYGFHVVATANSALLNAAQVTAGPLGTALRWGAVGTAVLTTQLSNAENRIDLS